VVAPEPHRPAALESDPTFLYGRGWERRIAAPPFRLHSVDPFGFKARYQQLLDA
jgi:hypothetical protein